MALPPNIEAAISARLGGAPPGAIPADGGAAGAGVVPGAQPGTPGAAGGSPAPKASTTPTGVEQAMSAATPKSEGDAANAAPMLKVKIGGQEREFTPEQIEGMTNRYRDLNFTHAQAKPLLEMADKLIEQGGGDYQTVAKFMGSLLERSNEKNPQMGNRAGAEDGKTPPNAPEFIQNIDAKMKDWMTRNSISEPPPGFSELLGAFHGLNGTLSSQTELLKKVMDQSGKVHQGAKQAVAEAGNMKVDAVKKQIQNNLNDTQQKTGLADESFDDFMTFAYERGFTVEDFISPDLTLKIMTDFKNSQGTPEFERLKQIHSRRQAFTGNDGGGPTGGGAAPLNESQKMFDQIAGNVMAKKGIK